jgi:hypothetical protein
MLAGLMIPGCRPNRSATDFIPSEALAQASVRAALEAWKNGSRRGELTGTKPLVFVTDEGRSVGQKLVGYEILGEVASDAGRRLAVRLELEQPRETVRTEYIVVGIDPIWVFRREDYEFLMHWDHHMPPSSPPEQNASTTARDATAAR